MAREAGTGADSAASDRAEVSKLHAGISGSQRVAESIGEAKGGPQVMPMIEAAPEVIGAVPKTPTVAGYLHELSKACEEAVVNARVRPLLFRLLLIAPRTLCELGRMAA